MLVAYRFNLKLIAVLWSEQGKQQTHWCAWEISRSLYIRTAGKWGMLGWEKYSSPRKTTPNGYPASNIQ